jgi:AIR synthase related protein, N-terminal domain
MVPRERAVCGRRPSIGRRGRGGDLSLARVPIPVGKLPTGLLARVLADLGPWPPDVRLGPAIGEDACALEVPAGVRVAATDPISLTGRQIGRLAVTVNANDVAVMGSGPAGSLPRCSCRRGRPRQTWRSSSPPCVARSRGWERCSSAGTRRSPVRSAIR